MEVEGYGHSASAGNLVALAQLVCNHKVAGCLMPRKYQKSKLKSGIGQLIVSEPVVGRSVPTIKEGCSAAQKILFRAALPSADSTPIEYTASSHILFTIGYPGLTNRNLGRGAGVGVSGVIRLRWLITKPGSNEENRIDLA